MIIGAYNNLPHYHVIGTPVKFYVWVDIDGSPGDKGTKWITGKDAFKTYNQLKRLFKKDKTRFMIMCEGIAMVYQKENS